MIFETEDAFVAATRGRTNRVEDEFPNLIDSWNGCYSKCGIVPDPGPTRFRITSRA